MLPSTAVQVFETVPDERLVFDVQVAHKIVKDPRAGCAPFHPVKALPVKQRCFGKGQKMGLKLLPGGLGVTQHIDDRPVTVGEVDPAVNNRDL
jgi:hypothetical protein